MPFNTRILFTGMLFILMSMPYISVHSQQREIDSLKKAIEADTREDSAKVIQLNALAYNYYTTNLDDLKVYGYRALILSRQIQYKRGEAVAYKNLGLGYLANNANPAALDYFDRSLKIFRDLNDRANSGRVLNNIGYYYGIIKDHRMELSYLLQALEQIKNLNEPRIKGVLYGNIGNCYEAGQQYKTALSYYNQELEIGQSKNIEDIKASSFANLASVYLKQKNYVKALYYCNQDLLLKTHSDNFRPRTLGIIYSLLGKIYYQSKSYAKARQALTQGSAIASQIGNAEEIASNYYDFYLLDSVKGDYQLALKNYYQYTRLNDSLTSVNKNQLVALYQVKFDSQKHADENQRLRVEEEKNEAVISQQRTAQSLLTIGLIIICIGAIYLKYIYDQVKAKNNIIKIQNQVLENNNVVKDKLFSVISHDLRSPITQVIGLLNLWETGELTTHEMSSLTPAVKSSIINTLELLDNLLIWSKNQLQGFHLNLEPFDLHQLTGENIMALNAVITQKQLTVENAILPGTMLNADREMIQIVLRNLISNAVKFTNPRGEIRIYNSIEESNMVICVSDTGIGIKEADRDKIFTFTTHTTLGTANEKGTGIGLKICKDFIELNNGRIWMESKENTGCIFCISIPIINVSQPEGIPA